MCRPVGRSSVPCIKKPRNFDVLINYYENPEVISPNADYVIRQTGTKTTAIRKILEERADIFLRYKAVLFLDDDIYISSSDIEKLFETMVAYGLDLCSKLSLSPNSGCHFDILKRPNAGLALTPLTAVEIMMPVISNRALRECGWVFQEGGQRMGASICC